MTNITDKQITELTKSINEALWGKGRGKRAMQLVYTIIVKGHRIDPIQVMLTQRLTGIVRIVQKRPDLHSLIEKTWY
ncbi:MAG: hypothetical protein VYC03_03645, partial [Pseudomonadota bacterium]|nr:hypothetical protein [Pseudomonadota bacterium]